MYRSQKFLPINRDILRRLNTDLHFISTDMDNAHDDVLPDENLLLIVACHC